MTKYFVTGYVAKYIDVEGTFEDNEVMDIYDQAHEFVEEEAGVYPSDNYEVKDLRIYEINEDGSKTFVRRED